MWHLRAPTSPNHWLFRYSLQFREDTGPPVTPPISLSVCLTCLPWPNIDRHVLCRGQVHVPIMTMMMQLLMSERHAQYRYGGMVRRATDYSEIGHKRSSSNRRSD